MTARRMLIAILQRTSAREMALRLGVSESRVSRWLQGEEPCAAIRVKLAQIYRVPLQAWQTSPRSHWRHTA